MNTRVARRMATTILAILVTAALGVGAAETALAAGSTPAPHASTVTPSTLKQRCEDAISRRLTFLAGLESRVNGASVLSAQHRAALLAILDGDHAGLTALDTKIEAETSLSELRQECHAIVTGYRVYVLAGPQVHLTIAADRVDFVDGRIQGLYAKLSSALQRCKGSIAQCQAAEQAFNDLQAKVGQSNEAVSGVAAEVLALNPAGYPGNESTLDAARTSVKTAHAALQGAWHDIQIIRQALRPSKGANPAAPTPTPATAAPSPAA